MHFAHAITTNLISRVISLKSNFYVNEKMVYKLKGAVCHGVFSEKGENTLCELSVPVYVY